MSNQPLWHCTNCGKDTPQNKVLLDDSVFHSPVIQYGCPNCRAMNTMERLLEVPPRLND
jgi:hypothetical protein